MTRRVLSGFLGLALAAFGLAGCGTYTLPRVVAQGTTIVIPVPDLYGAGFGRVLNQSIPYGNFDPATLAIPPIANSPLEDFQRGELLFALRKADSSLETYLRVRFITRVHLDEAGGAALPAAGESFLNLGTPVQSGQTLAVVDVPSLTPPDTYYIFVERWKRKQYPEDPSHFEKLPPMMIDSGTLPWLAWAGYIGGVPRPDAPMPIRVVALDPSPTIRLLATTSGTSTGTTTGSTSRIRSTTSSRARSCGSGSEIPPRSSTRPPGSSHSRTMPASSRSPGQRSGGSTAAGLS
jgi:hypothetical protein